MVYIFALGAAVSLITALALWLLWRQDKRQVFARSAAWAQIASTVPLVGYAAWCSSDPVWSGLGGGVLILSLAVTYTLLARALGELGGRRVPALWQWSLLVSFTLVYSAMMLAQRPELAGAFNFVVLTSAGLYATAKFWRYGLPERMVGLGIALMGINGLTVESMSESSATAHSAIATVLWLVVVVGFGFAATYRSYASIQQLRHRAEKLTEKSLQGIVVTDGVTLHYANPAALRIFGYADLEGAQKAGPLSVFLPERRAQAYDEMMSMVMGKKTYQDIERKAIKSDGTEIHVRLSCWPVRWDNKPAVQIVVIDDTAHHQAAVQLLAQQRAQDAQQAAFAERSKSALVLANTVLEQQVAERTRELAAASRAKIEFVANMSQEIRTPMSTVLGLLRLLQSTELASAQSDYVNKAERAAKSLLGLLNDVLDFSKIEAGNLALSPQPFEIELLLRDLSAVLLADRCDKPVEFIFDIDPQIPRVLVGDAPRFLEVLIHLTANALKFTAQGEVVVRIVVLASDNDKVALRVSVIDSGAGMAPEHLERIFDVFSQPQGAAVRRLTGPRLGLAICRRLLLLMGADLHAKSTPGKGSNFYFEIELPVADKEPRAQPVQVARPLLALIVDDNPTARECMAIMVIEQGWRAELADSGAAAVAKVQRRMAEGAAPYDILVVDWQLDTVDDMDGWQTLAHIQGISPPGHMPAAVMVSTLGRGHLAQRSPQELALLKAYLVKPFTSDMFVQGIAGVSKGVSAMRTVRRLTLETPKPLQGLYVLVVEDNLMNQVFARELLLGAGARVVVVENGAAGVAVVAAASQPSFDVVLMDMQMPVMDGCAATRAIRNLPGLQGQVPIIAMTANAMESHRKTCLDAGMNDHVSKPFEFAYLVHMILRYTQAASVAPAIADAHENKFDVDGAMALMGHDHELYCLILQAYLAELQRLPDQLDALLAAGDLAAAHRTLHTLKGTSATVGALHMMRTALAAELQLKDADPALDCRALADTLRQVAQETVQAMEPSLTTTITTNHPYRL